MKTMAIRLEDDLHAQLNVIASLEEQTITDIIRALILAYIESRKDALSSKAEAALEEIERDAQTRRQAIADLFGTTGGTTANTGGNTTPAKPSEPTAKRSGRTLGFLPPSTGLEGGLAG
jgi:predicted transcriptional regulator